MAVRRGELDPAGDQWPATIGHNSLVGSQRFALSRLTLNENQAQTWRPAVVRRAAKAMRRHGQPLDVVITPEGVVVLGDLLVLGARELGWTQINVRIESGRPLLELELMATEFNKLAELSDWDDLKLGNLILRVEAELPELMVDITLDPADIDRALSKTKGEEPSERQAPPGPPVARLDDMFALGKHRLLVGSAELESSFLSLMGGKLAAGMFTDPPYNVPINKFVSKEGLSDEFPMAVGEMDRPQFTAFLGRFIELAVRFSRSGAVHFICMDWRHLRELLDAGYAHYDILLNLCVWAKDRQGQGSMWRSQHELVFAWRVGREQHKNHIQLGKFGRNRSNLWSYPSAASFLGRDEDRELFRRHGTPKPLNMVADALLDCTDRGDLILDPFLGTGTTLIAAEKTGRICYGTELHPPFADLIVRRWQAWTGDQALHEATGLTFDELAAHRSKEQDDV